MCAGSGFGVAGEWGVAPGRSVRSSRFRVEAASERGWAQLEGLKGFYLTAKVRIWPELPDMCRIRSEAVTFHVTG